MLSVDKEERRTKRIGWPCYLVALLAFFGILSLFLPALQTETFEGETIFLSSPALYFGGLQTGEIGGCSYSLSFSFNYYLLALVLVASLAVLAVLFGRNTPSNLMIGIILLLVASSALPFLPSFCSLTNGSIPQHSISYAYGFFVSETVFAACFLLLIPLYVKSRRFWRAKRIK